MAKIMKIMALLSALITVLCGVLYSNTQSAALFALTITFATTAYHFAMRLLVGWTIHLMLRNHVDYRAGWFQVSSFEQKIYKALGIKKWKGGIPTYDPAVFDRKRHTWDEIAQATCQAELVHEVIIVLSFVPIFASISFGEFWVFAITSLLAACVDAVFVMLQRYNRPRILQLLEHRTKSNFRGC